MSFLRKPQSLWWRKAPFQVHLWVGLFAGLYAIVIGISGSILVFKDELAALSYPQLMRATRPGVKEGVELATVMERARAGFPKYRLAGGYLPGVGSENYLIYMEGEKDRALYVMADPTDGRILGALDLEATWLHWVSELHVRLLLNATGVIANAVGAALLLVLSVSGLPLWWPGIKRWKNALIVDFRRNWRRINFDLHSAVGLYTLVVIAGWCLSGLYFLYPAQFLAAVNVMSPVEAGRGPEIKVAARGRSANLESMISAARLALPKNELSGVYLGEDDTHPVTVFMARGGRNDFTEMDYVYFDPADGKQLAVWHSGVNPTWGSALVFWLAPLHFGVYWGLGVKALWAMAGLSLPVLAITGGLMYWNRALSRYWKQLKGHRKWEPEQITGEVPAGDQ